MFFLVKEGCFPSAMSTGSRAIIYKTFFPAVKTSKRRSDKAQLAMKLLNDSEGGVGFTASVDSLQQLECVCV